MSTPMLSLSSSSSSANPLAQLASRRPGEEGSIERKGEESSQGEDNEEIKYIPYSPDREAEYVAAIRQLISKDLSEPYSIYVYRYFLYGWGKLCFMAIHPQTSQLIGVVVSKLEPHRSGPLRGYIAMLAVRSEYRGRGIATKLVCMAIDAMIDGGADEVALETEVTNLSAMRLYERLGFLRSKHLHRYYLNGNSAYRLVLYLKEGVGGIPTDDGLGAAGGYEDFVVDDDSNGGGGAGGGGPPGMLGLSGIALDVRREVVREGGGGGDQAVGR